MIENSELIPAPIEGILSQNNRSAPRASGRQILYKPVEISSRDAKKISEVRKELGLEGESQLSLLEGISTDSFNTAELEIVRAFYKNRKTRKDVINPDLHLRNSDRAITKAGALFRNITGKPAFTKNIEVDNNSKLEKSEDFSLHYFDVQHEVQPVFNEVEKSVTEFIQRAKNEKEDLKVLLSKKDYQTFEKKVWLGRTGTLGDVIVSSQYARMRHSGIPNCFVSGCRRVR
ncbi:MAG: hypothetical protein KA052_00240 [Candidatus Pacebacteria bacterium]|nr:hypothetical protein [Candidatus Paceibacterota bacterium]